MAVSVVPVVAVNGSTIHRTAAEHRTVIVAQPTGLAVPDAAVPSRIDRPPPVSS